MKNDGRGLLYQIQSNKDPLYKNDLTLEMLKAAINDFYYQRIEKKRPKNKELQNEQH